MCKLVLLGWSPGLNKVALNHLLRDTAGMSLSEAKRCVDALLGNKMPEIPHLSQEQAEALLDSVNNFFGIFTKIFSANPCLIY